MNKNIYSIISILLLAVILITSYVYLNLPENFKLQLGGVEPGKIPIPPECIPFFYKFRYIWYIIPIFLLSFIIMYGFINQSNKLTYSDYGKIFLSEFSSDYEKYKSDDIPLTDPGRKVFESFIEYTKDRKQYSDDVDLFCFINSPCSCCNVPGYRKLNPTLCS